MEGMENIKSSRVCFMIACMYITWWRKRNPLAKRCVFLTKWDNGQSQKLVPLQNLSQLRLGVFVFAVWFPKLRGREYPLWFCVVCEWSFYDTIFILNFLESVWIELHMSWINGRGLLNVVSVWNGKCYRYSSWEKPQMFMSVPWIPFEEGVRCIFSHSCWRYRP
jgi:hypothetical protein